MTQTSRYRQAGVDIEAATTAIGSIRQLLETTRSPDQSGSIGHFGGIYRLPSGGDRVLVASADGVGTKLMLAFALGGDAHKQVGSDLVNHCVNDLLACGAKPLFFLDYFSTGKLQPEIFDLVVTGMATACIANGVALIGGETAEMPGLYGNGHYDLAGFIVGEVEPHKFIDGSTIAAGDLLLGLPSIGLHTNGFSLARSVIGLTGSDVYDATILQKTISELTGSTLADLLMAAHPSYLHDVQPLLEAGLVKGMAHITGGGLVDNVPRMLPSGYCAHLDSAKWTIPEIFRYLIERGDLPISECFQAFNMGIGFVLAIAPQNLDACLERLPQAAVIGYVDTCPDGNSRVVGLPDQLETGGA